MIDMMCHRQNEEISRECNNHFLEFTIQCLDIVHGPSAIPLLLQNEFRAIQLMINCFNEMHRVRRKICSRTIAIAHDHDQNKRGYCVE